MNVITETKGLFQLPARGILILVGFDSECLVLTYGSRRFYFTVTSDKRQEALKYLTGMLRENKSPRYILYKLSLTYQNFVRVIDHGHHPSVTEHYS